MISSEGGKEGLLSGEEEEIAKEGWKRVPEIRACQPRAAGTGLAERNTEGDVSTKMCDAQGPSNRLISFSGGNRDNFVDKPFFGEISMLQLSNH